jgi:GTP-binding protein LepA
MQEKIEQKNLRNFCIIAHIDHGKSTIADRMLELTHTVEKREMQEQLLDQMDIERERGITIKLAPVRMNWKDHVLNLIDTPGHVDFSYEVSRSLAAVEGAVLLVDAAQGIEAQTLSNLYAAIEHNLEIIPVVNKIDLPAAKPDEAAEEIVKILGCKKEDIIFASGKTGEGVEEILDRIVERVPSPSGVAEASTKALIFDSVFDPYRGVVAYVRIVDGAIKKTEKIFLMVTKSEGEAIEVGYFTPKLKAHTPMSCGEIGYIVTGFKEVSEARVGDTVTLEKNPSFSPLPGYKKVAPMVFASIYCVDGGDYPHLKEAIEKLKLNDASLTYELEQSPALGFGFRCGFLGLLHLEIIKERLEREYDLSLVISSPTVQYLIVGHDGNEYKIEKPGDLPSRGEFSEIREPWVTLEIFSPKEYLGGIMDVIQKKRAIYKNTEFIDENRAIIKYEIPLSEVIVDFYDQLKSISSGYASMNYEMLDFRAAELERVDILIAEEKVDALSFVIHSSKAQSEGRRITEKLQKLIPRQNFEIKIQATIGAKIIASERISPFRKDVTKGLYGGDVTRKNKLLDKQKKGKKKMKSIGRVEVPTDVFIKVLRNE